MTELVSEQLSEGEWKIAAVSLTEYKHHQPRIFLGMCSSPANYL